MSDEIKNILGEILSSLKSLDERVARLEAGGVSAAEPISAIVPATKRISIKEFLLEHIPTNGVQTTLAIAYYLEKYEGATSFNKADLEKTFRAAKETVPSNLNDKVNMCIKNGHMQEAEEKKENTKAWSVTRSGEQYVERKFDIKK